MQDSVHIAVLLTSHNRRDKTLSCLKSLYDQTLPNGCSITAYLVDDGSTDGTSEAVGSRFPKVVLLSASGSAYWNGGMRIAFAEAMQSKFDFFLWLNDDTVLYEDAAKMLLREYDDVSRGGQLNSIVAGATVDHESGDVLSGGYRFKPPEFLCRFELLPPAGTPRACATLSGNCLLIPAGVARELGNLSPEYSHFLGDFDYAMRARKIGCGVWLASRPAGSGSSDAVNNNDVLSARSLNDIFRKLQSPKGLSIGEGEHRRTMPPREWKTFLRAHTGPLWPVPWMLSYLKPAFSLGGRLIAQGSGRWGRRSDL